MHLTLPRAALALSLALAGFASSASAQAPVVPGHGSRPGAAHGGVALNCFSGSCALTARADLRVGNRRGRHVRHTPRRSSIVRTNRRGVCGPRPIRRVHTQRVWVPGYYEQVYRPPVYDYVVDACGRSRRVLVQHGYHERVWVPGRYEVRRY